MEYLYVCKNYDPETKKEPEKIYFFDKSINDPDPEYIYDVDLKKKIEVKRYWTYKAPFGKVN